MARGFKCVFVKVDVQVVGDGCELFQVGLTGESVVG